jgi:hypothetical protein
MTEDERRAEARARTDELRQIFAGMAADLVTAWRRRDWEALGFSGWGEYCEHVREGITLPDIPDVEVLREVMARRLVAAGLPENAASVAADAMHSPM